jgi:hypothetical protein
MNNNFNRVKCFSCVSNKSGPSIIYIFLYIYIYIYIYIYGIRKSQQQILHFDYKRRKDDKKSLGSLQSRFIILFVYLIKMEMFSR